jgi:hypothetical protein
VLICDADPKLAKSLPRSFHTTDDPIKANKSQIPSATGFADLHSSGCGEFTADGLKLLLARTRGPATSGWLERVGLGLFLHLTLL